MLPFLLAALALASVVGSFGCASPEREITGRLSSTVVHLANGDSVQVQTTVSAVIQGSPPGRMVIYHPFYDLSDTARLRLTATALFQYLKPQLDSAPPPFLVLRATDLPASKRKGFYRIHNVGHVLKPRDDGLWYFLGDSYPVPPPN